MKKPAPADFPIHPLLRGRWSPRGFDPGRPVDPWHVLTVLEAGRWAPSRGNEQPWRAVVVDGSVARERERVRECLGDAGAWARAAPVLVVMGAQAGPGEASDEAQAAAWHDVGMMSMSMALQANDLGLSMSLVHDFDRACVASALGMPRDVTPVAVAALGYPAPAESSAPDVARHDLSLRSRLAVHEWAYRGVWRSPLTADALAGPLPQARVGDGTD